MSHSIVPAGQPHAAIIAALHGACFDEPWDEEAILNLLAMPGASGWIALGDEDSPIGFLLFRTAADEAEIISIGVVAKARRKNVAKMLLDAAMDASAQAGVTRIFLEVGRDNAPAVHFYEKTGFIAVGVRENYYQRSAGRVDALIYRRDTTLK